MSTFGERIRQLRKEQDLPQRKVAALLDIDTSLLAKFERNERHPSKELITKIADLFKVDSNELINEVLTDKIAYQILAEEADSKILRVAEAKVEYLKKQEKSRIINQTNINKTNGK
ncbi:MAG: helix-turn-helix transcriptional regulator [Bacteroidetes bacterium]|nr:helix-turn-helix transcriptional regulator [Bacteroidota bacterium]